MMKMTKPHMIDVKTEPVSAQSPNDSPALIELLDHIAEVLALEYVRLMRNAAQHEGGQG